MEETVFILGYKDSICRQLTPYAIMHALMLHLQNHPDGVQFLRVSRNGSVCSLPVFVCSSCLSFQVK